MLPKKYPQCDMSRFTGLFFAIGLAIAASMSLFAININVKKSVPKAIIYPPVQPSLDEFVEEFILLPPPPPPPPIIICKETDIFCGHWCFISKLNDSLDPKTEEIDTIPFYVAEEIPRFEVDKELPNDRKLLGERFKHNMDLHIKRNLYFPEQYGEIAIQGRVLVLFVINTEGFVSVMQTRGPDKALEQKSREIIEKLPRFIPAKYNGKPIAVTYAYPILFKLR